MQTQTAKHEKHPKSPEQQPEAQPASAALLVPALIAAASSWLRCALQIVQLQVFGLACP